MRKQLIIPIIAIFLCVTQNACKKDIEEINETFPALQPLKADENAGVWKPILLSAPDEFAVASPDAITAPSYIADLNEIKGLQQKIDAKAQQNINYWRAGAVLRWNEIMRELVAMHNIPPYQNADGTYPIPSAGNPFAYPTFPFSNPPYAARAYAYVSAAQYDALIAAFHYKKLYGRKAPHRNDAGVKALIPASDAGAYPSEDGVVIGTTVELLKLLFPTDIAYIQERAAAHKLYRLTAGANTRNEVEAGELLGKAIAAKFVTRARTDRAGAAIGNALLWADLENKTAQTGEMPWISLESPKRPPMLPFFGRVRTFLFDSATLVSIRPPAPPSTNSAAFKAEANEVLFYSKSFDRSRIEIVHRWADGVNTYTPPGHWNKIAAEDFVKAQFSEVRWARNMALLNMSLMDAAIACWDTKYKYYNPRPSQFNPEIKTWTGIPNFPSYTSGHSTFSGAAATILAHIIPAKANAYMAMADEASLSRLYGAIHYRSDCEAGLACGKRVGAFAVQRARIDGAE